MQKRFAANDASSRIGLGVILQNSEYTSRASNR